MGIALSAVARLQVPLYNVQKAEKKLSQTSEKLATGKSVNHASDDVVSLLKAVGFETEDRGLEAINQYSNYRNSQLAIEDGSLSENLEQLQTLHDLALRSADASTSPADRDVLNAQAQDISHVDISSQSSANESLDDLNSSIQEVASQREQIGSESNRLDLVVSSNQAEQEQISRARSATEDVDVAEVTSKQVQNQLQMSFAIQVLKRSQQIESNQALKVIA